MHVEQEVHGDETLAIESVLECDVRRKDLLDKEKELSEKMHLEENKNNPNLSAELQKVYIELEAIEADKAVSRAAKILSGLGFSSSDQRRATKGRESLEYIIRISLIDMVFNYLKSFLAVGE